MRDQTAVGPSNRASVSERVTCAAAVALTVVGAAVLAGWLVPIVWLRGPFPGASEMPASTAVGLLLCGVSLWLLGRARDAAASAAGMLAGSLVTVIGLFSAVDYAFEVGLGVDHGIDPQTAVGFVFAGVALVLLRRRRSSRAVELLAGAVSVIALFSLVRYGFDTSGPGRIAVFTPIGPCTALAFLGLGAGLIAATTGGRLASAVLGSRSGSVMARRLLPLAALVLPVLGWLQLEGARQGWYGAEEGALVGTLLVAVVIAVLVTSRVLNERDAVRERAVEVEHRLAAIVDASTDAVMSADTTGLITSWNGAAEDLFGRSAAEALGQPIDILIPPDRAGERSTGFGQAIAGMTASEYETQRLRGDGTLVDVGMTLSPIRVDMRIVGVCAVARDVSDRQRTLRELERLVKERTAELVGSRAETLKRLALAAEYRDDATFQHTERVGDLAALLAELAGLSIEDVALVRDAAPLHDVGKLAIPDSILLKPGRLTDAEFEVMTSHTTRGAQILQGSNSDVLQMAERIALCHHERWDGTGYPRGLGQADIPLVGRLVAVADVYDALTHDRPYKDAWSSEEALFEIVRTSGSQFDPHVVASLVRLATEGLLSKSTTPSRARSTSGRHEDPPTRPRALALERS